MSTSIVTRTLCAGVLGAALAGMPPCAGAATDDKYYPGAMCVQTSPGGLPTYSLGSIGNDDLLQEMVVECPAVRDQNGVTRAWVRVSDASSGLPVKCQLFAVAFYSNATPGVFSPQVSSSGAQVVEELNLSLNSLVDGKSHYFVRCVLPPRFTDKPSYIRTYGIIEGP